MMDEYPVHARWTILAAIGVGLGMAYPLPYAWRLAGWTLAGISGLTLMIELGEWFMRQASRHFKEYRYSLSISKETEYVNALARLSEERFDFMARRNLLAEIEIGYGPRLTWNLEGVRIPLAFAKQWHSYWQKRGGERVLPADRDWDDEPHRDQMRAYNQHLRAVLKKEGFIDNPAGPLPARFLVEPDEALSKIGFWQVMAMMEVMGEGEYGNGLDSVFDGPSAAPSTTLRRPVGGWRHPGTRTTRNDVKGR